MERPIMAIAKSRKYSENFTIIANEFFDDDDLSADALGVLCYLRSKPTDWRVMATQLAARFKCGRERIARILKELIAFGYIKKTQARDAFTNKWKAFDYLVFDRKSASLPETASQPIEMPKTALRAGRSTAFPALLSTDLLPSTDSTNEDNIRIAACAAPPSEPNLPGALPEEESGNVGTRIGLPRSSNDESSARKCRQSPAESARAWREFNQVDGWSTEYSSEELNQWYRLIFSGHAADDIVDAAARHLRNTSSFSLSREDFLACFESYLEGDVGDAPSVAARLHATDHRYHEHGVAA
jgi:hypothetical protein